MVDNFIFHGKMGNHGMYTCIHTISPRITTGYGCFVHLQTLHAEKKHVFHTGSLIVSFPEDTNVWSLKGGYIVEG